MCTKHDAKLLKTFRGENATVRYTWFVLAQIIIYYPESFYILWILLEVGLITLSNFLYGTVRA